jgi:hypothetical protein
LDTKTYFSGAPGRRPGNFYTGSAICSGRSTVQQPAAEYANECRDDEKVEQREIFQNGRHGLLLLLISSGHIDITEALFVPRRSCSFHFLPVACGEGPAGFFKQAAGKP